MNKLKFIQKREDSMFKNYNTLQKSRKEIVIFETPLSQRIFLFKAKFFLILTIFLLFMIPIHQISNSPNQFSENSLRELWQYLSEEPEDLLTRNYSQKTSEQLLQKILGSEEEKYYHSSTAQSSITICRNHNSKSGFIVTVQGFCEYKLMEFYDNIAIYRKNEKIVIYGSEFTKTRYLSSCEIDIKTGEISLHVDTIGIMQSLDLLGVDSQLDVVGMGMNMTLVRNNNIYQFYHAGNPVGKTVTFPGGSIIASNYYYILDEYKDMYYLFYSDNMQNPWIRFVKVAENVVIEEDSFLKNSDDASYPIYIKDGIRYSGIPNWNVFKQYSNSFGINRELTPNSGLDFAITQIKLDEEDANNIVLCKRGTPVGYDWFLHYQYIVNGQTVYEEKRINGLDSYLTSIIPEEELTQFDEFEGNYEQMQKKVQELRQIYEYYI